ncbi:hypothetical protein KP509_05G068100 [Ceratopteris richardii]|nr:hypothetical protein KP509_05G068100 [Ceratopteris richardii]
MNAVSTPSDSVSCLSDCFEMDTSPKSSTPGSTKYSEVKLLVTHEQIDIKQRSGTGNNPNDGTAGHTKHVSSHLDSPVKADECATESDFEDWEAAADALGVCVSHESVEISGGSKDVVNESSLQPSFPESSQHRTCALSDAVPRRLNSRAWRPDDVHRPSSLPNIFNQQGQHLNVSGTIQQCMQPSQIDLQDSMSGPVLCPICAEELDTTDSSFEPCICGFQLCLFCHHRIASEDGRCPGCRKCYNS